jgi:hypothetical protein
MRSEKGKKLPPPFVHSDETPEPPSTSPAKPAESTKQDWRGFDWRSVASLRAPVEPGATADHAWDTTQWEERAKSLSPDARKIAEQIDNVAQRIRRGELSVQATSPENTEVAMAAALEALIRSR